MRLSQSQAAATFMPINLDNLSSRFVPDHHHEALLDRIRNFLLPREQAYPLPLAKKRFFGVQNSQQHSI